MLSSIEQVTEFLKFNIGSKTILNYTYNSGQICLII